VKLTPSKWIGVPLVWEFQVVPPSVVLWIVPDLPATVPLSESVKLTAVNAHIVPLVCSIHPCCANVVNWNKINEKISNDKFIITSSYNFSTL